MSPQAKGELLSARDGDNRPLFVNNASEGAVPVLLGAPVAYAKAAYKDGTSSVEDVLGIAGDWTQALYGTVEGVKIDISDSATLTIDNDPVNLWERNMFAVRAEIEVGFVADVNCFNKITRAHA
jgi:HK97 family phage major capsid protein